MPKKPQSRFIVTPLKPDPSVPKRYRRAGALVFDTQIPLAQHRWAESIKEAKRICDLLNAANAVKAGPCTSFRFDQETK